MGPKKKVGVRWRDLWLVGSNSYGLEFGWEESGGGQRGIVKQEWLGK